MESMYMNWARGNRVSVFGGITVDSADDVAYSKDYIAMLVPLGEAYNVSTEEIVSVGKANSRLKLIPKLSIAPKKYRIQVEPNPLLYEVADVFHEKIIEPDSDSQPYIYVKFRREFDLSQLDYLVRLYLVS